MSWQFNLAKMVVFKLKNHLLEYLAHSQLTLMKTQDHFTNYFRKDYSPVGMKVLTKKCWMWTSTLLWCREANISILYFFISVNGARVCCFVIQRRTGFQMKRRLINFPSAAIFNTQPNWLPVWRVFSILTSRFYLKLNYHLSFTHAFTQHCRKQCLRGHSNNT